MLFIVVTIALIFSAWISYEIYRAPLMKEEEDVDDDPTTTFWHEEN